MKFSVIVKRLSHPRVRRRLKIGLSVWGIAILIALLCKVVYDIGYFNAQKLKDDKNAEISTTPAVLTPSMAQRIVSGALKEDPNYPKTTVYQVVNNNQKLSTIIVENNKQKQIAWIIDMRLFFVGDIYNDEGYNLTEALEVQHNIKRVEQ